MAVIDYKSQIHAARNEIKKLYLAEFFDFLGKSEFDGATIYMDDRTTEDYDELITWKPLVMINSDRDHSYHVPRLKFVVTSRDNPLDIINIINDFIYTNTDKPYVATKSVKDAILARPV